MKFVFNVLLCLIGINISWAADVDEPIRYNGFVEVESFENLPEALKGLETYYYEANNREQYEKLNDFSFKSKRDIIRYLKKYINIRNAGRYPLEFSLRDISHIFAVKLKGQVNYRLMFINMNDECFSVTKYSSRKSIELKGAENIPDKSGLLYQKISAKRSVKLPFFNQDANLKNTNNGYKGFIQKARDIDLNMIKTHYSLHTLVKMYNGLKSFKWSSANSVIDFLEQFLLIRNNMTHIKIGPNLELKDVNGIQNKLGGGLILQLGNDSYEVVKKREQNSLCLKKIEQGYEQIFKRAEDCSKLPEELSNEQSDCDRLQYDQESDYIEIFGKEVEIDGTALMFNKTNNKRKQDDSEWPFKHKKKKKVS